MVENTKDVLYKFKLNENGTVDVIIPTETDNCGFDIKVNLSDSQNIFWSLDLNILNTYKFQVKFHDEEWFLGWFYPYLKQEKADFSVKILKA